MEGLFQPLEHGRGEGRAAGADETEGGRPVLGVVLGGPLQQDLVDGGHGCVEGRLVLPRILPEAGGSEAALCRDNDRGSSCQRGQAACSAQKAAGLL